MFARGGKNRDQKKSGRHAVMKFDFSVFFCLRFKVFSFSFLYFGSFASKS